MQKMDLDKNLKTHQINPLSYISEDDFWVNSHIKASLSNEIIYLNALPGSYLSWGV